MKRRTKGVLLVGGLAVAAVASEFELAADETWGLVAGPAGVPLPMHLYWHAEVICGHRH
jgi:hypothetical protein